MVELIQSGRIVDLILALMVIEAAVVCGFAFASRLRVPVAGLLLNLGAGACLLLALRSVATGAGWMAAGFWLSVALVAHVGDLFLRLRR
ncbi:MAG: hypothetical protein V2J42_13225 [Wenzhouxiangella sp.]|jgi:hypothetical protein|nr:hypothetical protein [Wenzhouxiangella sp.]